jgi:ubiquinone/menaquinone biosynthesis C-methylase UbiE
MTQSDIERFGKWASSYDKSILQRVYFGPIHSRMIDFFKQQKLSDAPSSILDVGCGTGRLLKAASIRWPKAQIFGVDPAEQMIVQAKQLIPVATFKVSEAESIPFPDQTMDLVFSSLSFHHWIDQEKGVGEIARVLRPKGVFCLADHTMLLMNWFKEKALSPSRLLKLISNAGLSVVAQKRLWLRFVLITLAQKG